MLNRARRHRMISGPEVVQRLPALAGREPTGGCLFFDCQTDDVRLVFTVLAEAERFGAARLTPAQLTGAYAGVRPLISSGDARKSVDISRTAERYETSSGLITITGGKLTTWRRMAKLAVDRMVERDGREAHCRTHEIPLGAPVEPNALARVPGVAAEAYLALDARYGHAATRHAEALGFADEAAAEGIAVR